MLGFSPICDMHLSTQSHWFHTHLNWVGFTMSGRTQVILLLCPPASSWSQVIEDGPHGLWRHSVRSGLFWSPIFLLLFEDFKNCIIPLDHRALSTLSASSSERHSSPILLKASATVLFFPLWYLREKSYSASCLSIFASWHPCWARWGNTWEGYCLCGLWSSDSAGRSENVWWTTSWPKMRVLCYDNWPSHHVMPCFRRQQDGTSHQIVSGTTQPLGQASRHPFWAIILCWGLDKPGLEHSSQPSLACGKHSWPLCSGLPVLSLSWLCHLLHTHARDLRSWQSP